ncbi:hypothetical protein [Kribbella sp. C-35]|uniref:hypothetical protein n=1 Tax=Kribbella sp. C-35 TaxID=2789276 RepID=UPI00397A90D8
MTEDSTGPLAPATAVLINAIKLHSDVVGNPQHEPTDAMRAVNDLRKAMDGYAETVFDISGWGNPFNEVDRNSHQSRKKRSKKTPKKAEGSVTVEAVYRLRVKDEGAALRLVESRTRLRGQSLSEDMSASAVDIVTELFRLDAWDPFNYPDEIIAVVDQEWTCSSG